MLDRCMPAGACLLLDARLTVQQASPAALALLRDAGPALALQHQRLCATGSVPDLDARLCAATRGATAALALPRHGRLALTLRADPWPVAGPGWVLVTLRDPELDRPQPKLLQLLFNLTPAETRVASGLAIGMDTAELAHAMGVQPNTVQSHIKRLLQKSGTRRQSQFVSLVLRSAAMSHPWLAGEATAKAPGLAQTGNDRAAGAGHSDSRPQLASCEHT